MPTDGKRHDGYGLLLVLIVTMFVASGGGGQTWSVVTSSVSLMIVLVAYFASPIRISRLRFAVLAVLSAAAPVTIAFTEAGESGRALASFTQTFVIGVILVALTVRVLARPVVDLQTLYGAVAIYMLIGLAFAWFYVGLSVWDNGQFSIATGEESQFFEFSFVVLTTLGFGNEVPTDPLAGRVVVLEAILGQMFLATFLARLVSMFGQQAPRR